MKQITENTILILLLLVGGIGLLINFNNKTTNLADDFEIVLSHNSLHDASSHEQVPNSMSISGTQEVGFPLDFQINKLTKNVQYYLELGNGDRLKLSTKGKRYIYEEPGNYQVNLIAVNNKGSHLVQSTKVRITQHFASGLNTRGIAN